MKIRKSFLQGAALLFTAVSVFSCIGLTGLGDGGLDTAVCPELGSGAMRSSFTADAKANANIRAFVQASSDLGKLAVKVEGDVASACERMGGDLGIPAPQMGNSTETKCAAVAAKIDAILKAGASVSMKASVTPPECKVSANAYAECSGQCSAQVDPGSVVANCEPAKLSGICEGTCGGSCDGVCRGDCSGECSAKDASGKCAGKCSGTCSGKCEATCHAKCTGTWKAPHCDVKVDAPKAEANCNASCKARAEITAQCTEGRVSIQSNVNVGEMPKLIATLQANLPVLIQAELGYGKRIAGEIETLVKVGGEMPNAMADAGGHALACIGASANTVVRAQASISISVKASASINAKAGAH